MINHSLKKFIFVCILMLVYMCIPKLAEGSGWHYSRSNLHGNNHTFERNQSEAEIAAYKRVWTSPQSNITDIRTGNFTPSTGKEIIAMTAQGQIIIYNTYGEVVEMFFPLNEPFFDGITGLIPGNHWMLDDINDSGTVSLIVNITQNIPGGKNYLIIYSHTDAPILIELADSEFATFGVVPFDDGKKIVVALVDRRLGDEHNNGVYYYTPSGELEGVFTTGDGVIFDAAGEDKHSGTIIAGFHTLYSQIGINPENDIEDDNFCIFYLNDQLQPLNIFTFTDADSGFTFWSYEEGYGDYDICYTTNLSIGTVWLGTDPEFWPFHDLTGNQPVEQFASFVSENSEGRYIFCDPAGGIFISDTQGIIHQSDAAYSAPEQIIATRIHDYSLSYDELLLVYEDYVQCIDEELQVRGELNIISNIHKLIVSDTSENGFIELLIINHESRLEKWEYSEDVFPTADFTGEPRFGVSPLTVNFTDQSTGDISAWFWQFGDGNESAEPNPVHQYTAPGIYTVTLTVSGDGGNDSESKTGYITVYEQVVADFSAVPLSGVSPLTVNFTDQSTGDISAWFWQFGDGNDSSEPNPVHQYTAPGIYTVTLTVSGDGGDDSETKTDYITVYEQAAAEFTAEPRFGASPLTVNFTDQSTGDISSWFWQFGDGNESSEPNPVHQYTAPGTYTVTLTVSGDGGDDSETKTGYITVHEPVWGDIDIEYRLIYGQKTSVGEQNPLAILSSDMTSIREIVGRFPEDQELAFNSWGTMVGYGKENLVILQNLITGIMNEYSMPGEVDAVCFHPSNDDLIFWSISTGGMSEIRLFDRVTGENTFITQLNHDIVRRMNFDTQGRRLFIKAQSPPDHAHLFAFDFESGQQPQQINPNHIRVVSWDFLYGHGEMDEDVMLYLGQDTFADTAEWNVYHHNDPLFPNGLEDVLDFVLIPEQYLMLTMHRNTMDNVRFDWYQTQPVPQLVSTDPYHSQDLSEPLLRLYKGLHYRYPVLTGAIYYDMDLSDQVNEGDKIKLIFNMPVQFTPELLDADSFSLSGDGFLGFDPSVEQNPLNSRELIITLGMNPNIRVDGRYTPYLSASLSTGIQLSSAVLSQIQDVHTSQYRAVTIRRIIDGKARINIRRVFRTVERSITDIDQETMVNIPPDSDTFLNRGGLQFPADSLLEPLTVSLKPLPPQFGINDGFQVELSHANFNPLKPPLLQVPYDSYSIDYAGGFLEHGIHIHIYNEDTEKWEIYEPSLAFERDLDNQLLTIPLVYDTFKNSQTLQRFGGPVPFANIGLATVEDARSWAIVSPKSRRGGSGFELKVGDYAVYTKHMICLPDYQHNQSGIEVSLEQVTLEEKAGFPTNAVLKVILDDEPEGSVLLTMEYKCDDDPFYASDTMGEPEESMTVFHFDNTLDDWKIVPGIQTVDTEENTVTVEIFGSVKDYQIYGVKPQPTQSKNWRLFE